MTRKRSYPNLIEEQFTSLLFAQVHLFNGNLATRLAIHGRAHDSCRSFADLQKTI